MPSPELWLVCITAFCAVGLLLAVLAALMRLILAVFPQAQDTTDTMMIAAVASVVASVYPGTRITKVEEIP